MNALLLFLSAQASYDYNKHTCYTDSSLTRAELISLRDVALTTAAVGICAVSVYALGRLCSAGIYSMAEYRYKPELDLLARAAYNEDAVQNELVPYVLAQHDRNNSLFFFLPNRYKNYPLLQYKNDLDWYINRLWLSKIFYLGIDCGREITILMEKLERIRRYIVTDYRFVKEQRDFDHQARKLERTHS